MPVRQPVHELRQVQGVQRVAEHRRGEAAEGVPAVCLRAGLPRDATFVRLAPRNEIAYARVQFIVLYAEHARDGEGGVAPAGVRLAALVHPVPAAVRVLAPHEKRAELRSIDASDRGIRGDLREARDRRVGWREVWHLPRAAAEAAVGVLAEREELDDVGRGVRRERRAEQRQRVDDPVAEPAS